MLIVGIVLLLFAAMQGVQQSWFFFGGLFVCWLWCFCWNYMSMLFLLRDLLLDTGSLLAVRVMLSGSAVWWVFRDVGMLIAAGLLALCCWSCSKL